MNSAVFDTSVIIKSIFKPAQSMSSENYKRENYFMALAKMKNAVLVTGDGKMHFHAEEVGDSGLIRVNNLNWIEYKLKADS